DSMSAFLCGGDLLDPSSVGLVPAGQELHMVRDDLDRAAAVAFRVLPRLAPQGALGGGAAALCEAVGARLGPLVPGGDANEIGTVATLAIDRDDEARHAAAFAERLELDVRGEVSDQADDVHVFAPRLPLLTT